MAKNKVSPKRKAKKSNESNSDVPEDAKVVEKVEETPENAEADNAQEGAEQGSEDSEQGSEDPEQSSESDDSEAKDEGAEDPKKETEQEKKPEKPKKTDTKPAKGADQGTKEKKLAGLIFMCKSSTKEDCFRYRVFGLPQSKKDLVERIRPNMKLFLFDSDQKLLHGIYLATSRGGMNLEPRAFGRGFPAQVKFRIQKECLPLAEDAFKTAIKDNYFDKKRFNFELSGNQVKKLSQLFRPVPRGGKVQLQPQPQGTSSRYDRLNKLGYEANGLLDGRARREIPFGAGYGGIPDYLPPKNPPFVDPLLSRAELRRLEYARDAPVPVDPYQDAYLSYCRQIPRGIPDGLELGQTLHNPDPELDLLYRQRLQLYSDPLLDRGLVLDPLSSAPIRKRAYDDAFVDDRALLLAKRQAQDELLYRELEYQRAAPSYLDERLAARYYAGV